MYLQKAIAFIKRDYIIESSYRLGFILNILGSFFPLIMFYFIGQLIGEDSTSKLSKYGGEYFPFVLIGLAFTNYFRMAISTFGNTMRRAQMAGCLEAILSSQTEQKQVVVLSSLYSFISSGIIVIFIFIAGVFLFGFSFAHINIISSLFALTLSIITFVALGIISAAGIIIFKQGEPFGWLFGTLSGLLGGAFFPLEIMPDWLRIISYFIPISYSLDALRLSILKGYTIAMISNQLVILGGIALVLLPLSLRFFQFAIEKGKRDGTLMHY